MASKTLLDLVSSPSFSFKSSFCKLLAPETSTKRNREQKKVIKRNLAVLHLGVKTAISTQEYGERVAEADCEVWWEILEENDEEMFKKPLLLLQD